MKKHYYFIIAVIPYVFEAFPGHGGEDSLMKSDTFELIQTEEEDDKIFFKGVKDRLIELLIADTKIENKERIKRKKVEIKLLARLN